MTDHKAEAERLLKAVAAERGASFIGLGYVVDAVASALDECRAHTIAELELTMREELRERHRAERQELIEMLKLVVESSKVREAAAEKRGHLTGLREAQKIVDESAKPEKGIQRRIWEVEME